MKIIQKIIFQLSFQVDVSLTIEVRTIVIKIKENKIMKKLAETQVNCSKI